MNADLQTNVAPSVCVIIAAYNAAGTLARAVESALAEPEVAEVVVVDDASTDNTLAAARSADDGTGRLKIIIQPINSGPSAARNRAIAESISPWIAVLDADDFFVPGRFKTLLEFSESADFIADDMWQVDEGAVDGPKKNLLGSALTKPETIDFKTFVLSNVTRAKRERAELGFIKPLMRRHFMKSHALHYQEHMRLGEDYELYARALGLGARLLLIPQQGYVSVVRPNSLSGQHSETDLLNLRNCGDALRTNVALSRSEKRALRRHYLSVDCRLQWRLLITAVKQRNIHAALATFLRPYPVPLYLCNQLLQQLYRRIF